MWRQRQCCQQQTHRPATQQADRQEISSWHDPSKRVIAAFVGTNADNLLKCRDKNFAVAYLAAVRRTENCFKRRLKLVVTNGNLKLGLRNKIDDVFCAAIQFGMPFLPPEALDFGNGHTLDT